MIAGLPLMKRVVTPLAESVFIRLGLAAGMLAADVAIQKKVYGSGRHSNVALRTTELIISNVQSLDFATKK